MANEPRLGIDEAVHWPSSWNVVPGLQLGWPYFSERHGLSGLTYQTATATAKCFYMSWAHGVH